MEALQTLEVDARQALGGERPRLRSSARAAGRGAKAMSSSRFGRGRPRRRCARSGSAPAPRRGRGAPDPSAWPAPAAGRARALRGPRAPLVERGHARRASCRRPGLVRRRVYSTCTSFSASAKVAGRDLGADRRRRPEGGRRARRRLLGLVGWARLSRSGGGDSGQPQRRLPQETPACSQFRNPRR